MKRTAAVAALCTVLLLGCNTKEEELQKKLDQTQTERSTLQQNIAERDKYIEEVMQSVNEVYTDLEQARAKEGKLLKGAGSKEGSGQPAVVDTRQKVLHDISDIGLVLKENRKKIADIQHRLRLEHNKIAALDTLISNLKVSLQEREQSIAQLQAQVQGLENTVAEKTRVIEQKDNVIDQQQRNMNTGYYVVGTKDELKKKGIITDEGGFLWGLLGSTTVMASDFDKSNFTPIDKTKGDPIHVDGKIEEILPRRNQNFFATDEQGSSLKIVSPDRFWQNNYLVIVVD